MSTSSNTETISIPSLTPSAPLPSSSIAAVVSLVWPYSSRTHSYALLLSDPDFRLRYQRGQVRIVFTGAAGRAIARQRVGIGDKVVLDLNGGKWLGTGDGGLATVRTPGKSVEGDIGFEDVLQMKVVKGDKEVSVTIEEQDMIKGPDVVKRTEPPSTPARTLGRGTLHEQIYSSPAFMRRLRASGEETSSPIIDQMEWEGDEELDAAIARKKRRVSYKHVTEWKVVRDERQESDEAVGLGLNLAAEVEEEAEEQVAPGDLATKEVLDLSTETATDVQGQHPESSTGPFTISSPSQQSHLVSKPQTRVGDDATAGQAIKLSSGALHPGHDILSGVQQEGGALAKIAQDPVVISSAAPVDFTSTMAPPPLPRLGIPQIGTDKQILDRTGPQTPRLNPVSPNSLPFPSPFPQTPLGTISPAITPAPTTKPEKEDAPSTESVAQPDYFDQPPSTTVTILEQPEQNRSSHGSPDDPRSATERVEEVTDPSDELPKQSNVVFTERDAASSPSSGSEADVSSDDENGSDSEIPQLQDVKEQVDARSVTATADANDTALSVQVTEGEVVYREDNIVMAEDQDPDAMVHTSDSQVSVSLSDRSDDDADDDLEQDPGQSQMQVLEDVVMLDDASEHENQYDSSSTPAPTIPDFARRNESAGPQEQDMGFYPSFGLDGAFASKVQNVTPAPAGLTQTERTTPETTNKDQTQQPQLGLESVRSSQGEDAAWAALDEAVTTMRRQEENHKESSRGVLGQRVDEDDQPDSQLAFELQSPTGPLAGIEAIPEYDTAAVESSNRYESKPTSQKSSFVKRMQAFREMSQRSRRSPSIEEVDLSGVEPDYMDAYLSQTLSQTLRPAAMVESQEVIMPTNTVSDSEAVYREDLDNANGQYITETVEKVLSSREAGFSDYLQAQAITSDSDLVMDMIKQEPDNQIGYLQAEDEAIDNHLLLEFVNAEPSPVQYSEPAGEEDDAKVAVEPGVFGVATAPIDGNSTSMSPISDSGPDADVEEKDLPKTVNGDVDAPAAQDSDLESEITEAKLAENHDVGEETATSIDDRIPGTKLGKIPTDLLTEQSSPNVGRQLRSQAGGLHSIELAEDDLQRPTFRSAPESNQTLHACSNCAKRKTRCDKKVPCSQCSARDIPCTLRPTRQSSKDPSRMVLVTPEPLAAASDELSRKTKLADDTVPQPAQTPMFESRSQAEESRMQKFAKDFASVTSDLDQASEAPPEITSPQTPVSPIPEEPSASSATKRLTHEARMQKFAEDFASVEPDLQQASEAPSNIAEPQTALLPVPEEPITTPATKQPRDRAKKIPRYSRLSLNTEALSEWFTPPKAVDRRKTTTALRTETFATPRPARLPSITSKNRSVSPPPIKRFSQTPGTATELSYFTPLTNLDSSLNDPTSTIDVLAVVCDKTSDPVRAKSGPRDWFTVFRIVDPDVFNQSTPTTMIAPSTVQGIRVEIYRPWKASLPTCSVGDVVLFRGFVVRSRKHTPYLLSGDASAWVVWRYDIQNGDVQSTAGSKESSVEEARGPPVEYGEQERGHAGGLRSWWHAISR